MPKKHGPPQHFIRQWRKHRGVTLEKLAERIGMTHQNLGKIERGQVPATDHLFAAVSEALSIDRASLMMRDPSKPDFRWSIWEEVQSMTETQGAQATEIIKALKRAS
jgi:transcriptional regulator with XRE-family HTH domain